MASLSLSLSLSLQASMVHSLSLVLQGIVGGLAGLQKSRECFFGRCNGRIVVVVGSCSCYAVQRYGLILANSQGSHTETCHIGSTYRSLFVGQQFVIDIQHIFFQTGFRVNQSTRMNNCIAQTTLCVRIPQLLGSFVLHPNLFWKARNATLTSTKYFSAFRFHNKISPFPLPSGFLPIVFKKLLGSVPPMELWET